MQAIIASYYSNNVNYVTFGFFSETTDDEQFGKLLEKVAGNCVFSEVSILQTQ